MDGHDIHFSSIRFVCVAIAAPNGGGRASLPGIQLGQQSPRVRIRVGIHDGVFPADAGDRLRPAQCAVDVNLAGTC